MKPKQITMNLHHKVGPIRTAYRQGLFWVCWAARFWICFWINQKFLESAIPTWALVFLLFVALTVIAANTMSNHKYDSADDAKRAVDAFFSN